MPATSYAHHTNLGAPDMPARMAKADGPAGYAAAAVGCAACGMATAAEAAGAAAGRDPRAVSWPPRCSICRLVMLPGRAAGVCGVSAACCRGVAAE